MDGVWNPVHRKIIVARDVVIEEFMSNRRLEESSLDQARMLPEQVSETNRNIEFTVRHLEVFGYYLNTSTEGIGNVKNTNFETTNRSVDIVGNTEETCQENSNDTPDVIDNTVYHIYYT